MQQFSQFTNLNVILSNSDLEQNDLTDLNCGEDSPFKYLPIVKIVGLRMNRLTKLAGGCFIFNSLMVELDLGQNLIEWIDVEAFNGLDHLSKL